MQPKGGLKWADGTPVTYAPRQEPSPAGDLGGWGCVFFATLVAIFAVAVWKGWRAKRNGGWG